MNLIPRLHTITPNLMVHYKMLWAKLSRLNGPVSSDNHNFTPKAVQCRHFNGLSVKISTPQEVAVQPDLENV